MIGDIGSLSNLSGSAVGGGVPVRLQAEAAARPVVPVETGARGQGASGRLDNRQAQTIARYPEPERGVSPQATTTETRVGPDARRPDPEQIAGPSPAFQASVLELERDLQNSIARLEAARGKRESDVAQGLRDEAKPADTAPAHSDEPAQVKATRALEPPEQTAETTQQAQLRAPVEAAVPGEAA